MWFLSCDGEHLNNKQIWLRPGSKHLFGRTHSSNGESEYHAISHKSVSRQHFELQVAAVESGASAQLHKRSKITLTDLGSKVGTFVDSDKVQSTSKALDKTSHVIRLGNYDCPFRIRWKPVVLTFSSISRLAREAGDPLAEQRSKLEQLDIKIITEYVLQSTTHVIGKKRNTATSLQALVNGRFVVTELFVDAIASAAHVTHSDHADVPKHSNLEENFDANWPKELEYLPPPGQEPNPRENHDEIFLPNMARSEIFSNYTFVFAFKPQYDTFLPVITGGGGKPVLREVAAPEDDPDLDDFLDFIKSCAGKKGDDAFRLSQFPTNKGGVVVVRPGDPGKVGGAEFFQKVDLALDQRGVEQNEFLEAILTADAKLLRRALEIDRGSGDATDFQRCPTPRQENTPPAEPLSSHAVPPATTATKPRTRRAVTRKRITTFDDFDPSQIVKYSPPPSQNGESVQASQVSAHDSDVEIAGSAGQAGGPSQTNRGKKRPANSQLQPVESTEQVLDGILTGQAALKRRRLEEAKEGRSTFSGPSKKEEEEAASQKPKKTNEEKQKDLEKAMQARREEQERLRNEDEEKLRHAVDGMDVSEMRNLAQIEIMEIPTRRSMTPNGNANGSDDTRWKPEWNGRANWKKFKKRRPGQAEAEAVPPQRRVIVELRPYNPDEGSIVDSWLDPVPHKSRSSTNTQRSRSSRASGANASQATVRESQPQHSSAETDELRRRIERSRLDDERENDETDLLPDEIGGQPRDPTVRAQLRGAKDAEVERRKAEREQRLGGGRSQRASGSTVEVPDSNGGRARAAESRGTKRSREVAAVDDSDEESDDGQLRFRRRRR